MKFNFKVAGIKVSNVEIGEVEVSTELDLNELRGINDMTKELITELPNMVETLRESFEKASQPIIVKEEVNNKEELRILKSRLETVKIQESKKTDEWLSTFDKEKSDALRLELEEIREHKHSLINKIFKLKL